MKNKEEVPIHLTLWEDDSIEIKEIYDKDVDDIIVIAWIDYDIKAAVIYYNSSAYPNKIGLKVEAYQNFLYQTGIKRINLQPRIIDCLRDYSQSGLSLLAYDALDSAERRNKKLNKKNL